MAPLGGEFNGFGKIDISLDTQQKSDKIFANADETEAKKALKSIYKKFPQLKEELVDDLSSKKSSGKNVHKYLQHAGYKTLREKYGNNLAYVTFFATLKIEGNNVILGNKKFSMLTAPHDGNDVFSGDHQDKNGNTGISGVTYMTGKKAEETVTSQNKRLFATGSEIDAFINTFPGETQDEKIRSFVTLFGLQKAGYWDPHTKEWLHVGSVGYVGLSDVTDDGNVRTVSWSDASSNINWLNQKYPQSFLAFEDC